MRTSTCGALGWWGSRSYLCELDDGHVSKWHENNAAPPGVIWVGDHTPPCACGRCPEVLPDGQPNAERCVGDHHVIPHRGCILR